MPATQLGRSRGGTMGMQESAEATRPRTQRDRRPNESRGSCAEFSRRVVEP